MTASKLIYTLLGLASALTAAAVAVALTHHVDTAVLVVGLLKSAAGVTWCVLAITVVGQWIVNEIRGARRDALQKIAQLERKWGDKVGAAELEHRLSRAEEGSGGSLTWLKERGI